MGRSGSISLLLSLGDGKSSSCARFQKVSRLTDVAFAQLPADDTNAERGEVNDGIHSFDWSSIPRPDPIPRTLCEWASRILSTSDPLEKVAYTQYAGQAFRQGECRVIARGRWNHDLQWTTPPKEQPPIRPPRPESVRCVKPGAEGKRGKAGTERSRIALLHALANIEQWAIDLAWDIIARAPRLSALAARTETNPCPQSTLPVQFYTDFVKIAIDEAKHFTLLQKRLMELGSYFGELPVHHGLWDSAMETSENLFARLSIIHLVHEARGLDVNPVTIRKFQAAGDQASVAALNVIHLDEITHVSAGHRWLTYLCANHPTPLNPIDVFRDEVRKNFVGRLKGPFNESDRMQAGLSKAWYDGLSGEKASRHAQGVHREEVPGG
ncbi:hypothetical protein MPSI1_003861 [Malassezia psittaci]|uniref:DUF455-domain-containing protein n=1 Tax=Malassezia psittaci TaxID=1821823 RepID=A0AAF0F9M5_9BASI|nr:hypothetical protein MPSI1_003861 [Malassezia psittaci]